MMRDALTEKEAIAMEKRVRDSFDKQGLMHHLGATITRVVPGIVHIQMP